MKGGVGKLCDKVFCERWCVTKLCVCVQELCVKAGV